MVCRPAAIALAEQFNGLVDIDRIDTDEGKTFVLIDDINKRPSSAFCPGLSLPPNASPDSRILKQCLEHRNVHVIMWCNAPANMHLEGRNDFNASFSEYEECRNLPEDKAWLHVGTQKNLLTLYKPLTPEEKEKLNENINKVK